MSSIRLQESWLRLLEEEFNQGYFTSLKQFLIEEKAAGHILYPPGNCIFAAFDYTPLDEVKVVVLGQDPYHGPNQANGLCFSVSEGVAKPPSLKNIFKELKDDLGIDEPPSGNLERWARNGVLLLNATLTVRQSSPGSHQGRGWERFTDKIISLISEHKDHVVFILWGKYAQSKESLIDPGKHLIIKSAHPSPFSAHTGFLGSKPFSKANLWLESKGIDGVDWRL